ncbi:Zinc finger CCCH domain-containing protein 14 [Bagarius yarrelli]|uniref:Zinc finger CCCH domain-containing protein 14 n=1 Tax=Bagarius yarrelli TaxID=175774 RepID=A0A556VWF3_BAGYA|nr:Zinc finger CCCH domain-containing protein 14 [Bagarius yarrelli]
MCVCCRLHGVLEKLRSAAVEPASLHAKLLRSDTSISGQEDCRGEESRALTVSSSRSDRLEGRVSSSAHEHHDRRMPSDHSPSSRLTSKVKPLLEHTAEAVIDIKPDLEEDDLISDEPRATIAGKLRPLSSHSSNRGSGRAEGSFRLSEVIRGQDRSSSVYGRSHREDSSKEDVPRKRKAPVASSVVRIQKSRVRVYESEEDEDDEEDYGVQSRRQTVPVAPRTRSASDEMNRAAIRLVQQHLHQILPQEVQPTRPHELQLLEAARLKTLDTRSFIMRKPEHEQNPPIRSRLDQEEAPPTTPRTVQTRTFPSCVFGEKCLFIHPNCKYNGKCSKPDCPYTHINPRALPPPPKPALPQSSNVCRFFPECKRTDCTFYHPKSTVTVPDAPSITHKPQYHLDTP